MPSNYPTKETILEVELKYKPALLSAIKEWKRTVWKEAKDSTPMNRFDALKALVMIMATHYNKPVDVHYVPDLASCCYVPLTKTICMNRSLSIISTMHEFAHHLYGEDETKACKWSVWLFKKTFPKSYEQLTWEGHMLVRRNPLMEYESEVASFLKSQLNIN